MKGTPDNTITKGTTMTDTRTTAGTMKQDMMYHLSTARYGYEASQVFLSRTPNGMLREAYDVIRNATDAVTRAMWNTLRELDAPMMGSTRDYLGL